MVAWANPLVWGIDLLGVPMRVFRAAVFALPVLALAACSSRSAPAATPAAAKTTVTATSAAPAAVSPTASVLGDPFGTAQKATDQGVTIQATASSYSVVTLTATNQELLPAGTKVAIVQAQGCVTANTSGSDISLSWNPWTLVTSTGATVQALSAYGTRDFPGSLYPNDPDSATPTGRCRSGLIPFSLAGISGTPVAVEYDVNTIVLDWVL